MAKVSPFHSTSSEDKEVYHDDSECPYGQRIKPENRASGNGGRPKCSYCKG